MLKLVSATLGVLVFVSAPAAMAQVDMDLEPTSSAPLEPEPVEAEPAPVEGEAQAAAEGNGTSGFYYYDDAKPAAADREPGLLGDGAPTGGPVPEVHVVRSGDTLWDLCEDYLNNAWDWPRVWSLNPSITNPHWIYPGDLVRLREDGGPLEAAATSEALAAAGDPGQAAPLFGPAPVPSGFALKRLAFVARDQLELAFSIVAAEEEREMLSFNDIVYLDYPAENPPQVGRRYAIYSEREPIQHPDGGGQVGSFVNVLGDLEVLSVKQGKRARAVIRASHNVIERGKRVGPLQRTFENLADAPNRRNLQGTIVAQLRGEMLIGALQIVFMDLGSEQGVEPGNRMYIVRRGDARPDKAGKLTGIDDQRYPAYAVGEVIVVDVGEKTSMAVVTQSLQESGAGDRVMMRKSR